MSEAFHYFVLFVKETVCVKSSQAVSFQSEKKKLKSNMKMSLIIEKFKFSQHKMLPRTPTKNLTIKI